MSPAMKPFGTDFGNGDLDQKLFQIDRTYPEILENKRNVRRLGPANHIGRDGLRPEVEARATQFLESQFAAEWPEWVGVLPEASQEHFESELDRIVAQVPADIAIVQVEESGADRAAYLNICAVSHWDPREKLGKSFFSVHESVPGFERANAGAAGLVQGMVQRGPWVRFVWGLETDTNLNHHPEPLPGFDRAEWRGRHFLDRPLQIRFERQITWPLPEVGVAIFVIRVGFVPMDLFWAHPDWQAPMKAALEALPESVQRYKGVHGYLDAILAQFK